MRSSKSFRFLTFALLAFMLGLVSAWIVVQSAQAGQVSPGAGETGKVRLLSSDEQGVSLELNMPEFHFEPGITDDGTVCQILRLDGYASTDHAGSPHLPVKGVMVGIPLSAQPSLHVVKAEAVKLDGKYTLCPVERSVVENELDVQSLSKPRYVGQVMQIDPQAYDLNLFLPQRPAELAMTGFVRSQRVAQVRFQPFQYNPVTGELRYYRVIRLALKFNISDVALVGSRVDEGDFEALLQDSLLNYSSAIAWRTAPQFDDVKNAPVILSSAISESLKLLVKQEGIYKVTYEELAAAGLNFSTVNVDNWRMFNEGQEVAFRIVRAEYPLFQAGDYILFYGRPVDTKYTATNIYFLQWGDTAGMRIPAVSGAPNAASIPLYYWRTRISHENTRYLTLYPSGPDKDVWYEQPLVYAMGSPAYADVPLDLPHLYTGPVTATLTALLRSYKATPDHHTRIYVNGNLVFDQHWPNGSELNVSVGFPQAYLSQNTSVRIEAPLDGGSTNTEDIVLINWIKIGYASTYSAEDDALIFGGDMAGLNEIHVGGFTTHTLDLYEITNPFIPSQLTDFNVLGTSGNHTLSFGCNQTTLPRRYYALSRGDYLSVAGIVKDTQSNLKSIANSADYILITHADFYTSVLPLADYRASQGMRVKVVDVEDIYDEFNHGIVSPTAIHDFLAYAYSHWWPPAPTYVLLVGDATFDPRDYWGLKDKQFIPAYLVPEVDPFLGETAAENRFVTVSGTDILPDMALGRIPVNTAAEAAAVVAKILDYEQTTPDRSWTTKTLFLADNADEAGDFAMFSDWVADHYVPSVYSVQKIYYLVNYPDLAQAKADLVTAINQGVLLANYVGHASLQAWGSEKYLNSSIVASLTNAGKLPFMVPMTCLEGTFDYPSTVSQDNSSLAEILLRKANAGSVGGWSPTGLGVVHGHDYLHRGLYQAFFSDYIRQVGPATMRAKLYLFTQAGGGFSDLLDTYMIFGDPALELKLRNDFTKYSPAKEENGASINPTLSWAASNDAVSYEYCVDTTPDNTCNGSWNSVGSNTSVSLSGLTYETTYYWQVRAINTLETTEANYGEWWTFTTQMAPPGGFSKFIPVDGDSGVAISPTLSWNASSGVTSYEYCYDTSADNVCSSGWIDVGANITASISGLAYNSTYFWQVRAKNAGGSTEADQGTWWSFKTVLPPVPGAFGKAAPVNEQVAVSTDPALYWGASSYATAYEYCYDTTDDDNCAGSWIDVGLATTAQLLNLTNYVTYYWQVRAKNVSGLTQADENIWWSFTTTNVPAPLEFGKSGPGDQAVDVATNPLLSWEASVGASLYEYCYDTQDNHVCDSEWISNGINIQANISGLDYSTAYYWQVRSKNTGGMSDADGGSWWKFTTVPPPPPAAFMKVVPEDGSVVKRLHFTLAWLLSDGADSYEYCLDKIDNDVCDNSWVNLGTMSSITYNVFDLRPNTTYYWQIRAVNGGGFTEADDHAWYSFTTLYSPLYFPAVWQYMP